MTIFFAFLFFIVAFLCFVVALCIGGLVEELGSKKIDWGLIGFGIFIGTGSVYVIILITNVMETLV